MKVLMINGSPNERGTTFVALSEIAGALEKNGVASDIVWLGKQGIRDCMGCGACRKNKLGKCVIGGDAVNEIGAVADGYDGLIVGSPVYYAGPSATVTAFLDRLFYSAGEKFADKPAACVVCARRGGASASFDRLNKYFTINNMPVVSANYWNQVHGPRAEDAPSDEEGLQTMRILGENMAWLVKCIDAAKKAGIPMPVREAKIMTNFNK